MTLYIRQSLHLQNLTLLSAELGVQPGFIAWIDGYGRYTAVPAGTYTVDGLHVISGQDNVQWTDETNFGGGGGGSQGPQGPQGPQGSSGATGSQGAQGSQGAVGATGSQGSQGPQGVQGSSGNQGAQGPQGATGNRGYTGVTGPAGMSGILGAKGIGIEPDVKWPKVLTTGGSSAATLSTLTPSLVVLPNNAEINVSVRVEVWEPGNLSVRGEWEFEVLVARISSMFGPIGVLDVTNANTTLPAGFAVGLEIDGYNGLLIKGTPATNNAYWAVSCWFHESTALDITGGSALNPAPVAPTLSIDSPSSGYAWLSGTSYRVAGVFASLNARVIQVEVLDGYDHLAYATLGSGVWEADVIAPVAGTVSLQARATTVVGNFGDSAIVTGTADSPDITAPTITAFTLPTDVTGNVIDILSFTATDTQSATIYYQVTTSSTPPDDLDGNWSSTPPTTITVGSTGTYTFYPWVMDLSRNISSVYSTPRTVVVTSADVTAPIVTAFSIPGNSASRTITISSFTATDDVGVTGYVITEDTATVPSLGAFGTLPTTISAGSDGSHLYRAYARDAAGNIATPLSASCLVDTIAPVVTAFTLPIYSTSSTINISTLNATDTAGVTGYAITEDTATVPSLGAFGTLPTTISAGSDGYHTYRAYARDAAGNISSPVIAMCHVDTAAPNITAFTLASTSTSLSVTIDTLTTSEVSVGWYLSETGTIPGSPTWLTQVPSSFTVAGSGLRTVYLWVIDAAGNVSARASSSSTVTLADVTAPTMTAFAVPSTSTSLTITFDTPPAATDAVGVTGYAVTADTATVPELNTFVLPTPTSITVGTEGSHTLRAYARDAAGNISTSLSGSCSITLPDVTAPTMTAFAAPATSTSLTITFDTPPAATDAVGVTGYAVTIDTVTAPDLSVFALPTPTAITVGSAGSHTLRAYARDAAGNISTALSSTCLADGTAPTMTAFASPAISTSLTITFDTPPAATDAIGVTGYAVTDNTATLPLLSSFASPSPTFIIVGTQGNHTLRAYARDSAGNISSASLSATSVDTAAPTITAFTMPATNNSLTVPVSSWTSTDAVGVTGWIIVTDSNTVPSLSDGYWTGSAWTQVVCTTEGAHSFYAYTRDAAGYISTVATQSTTITLPDVTAPVITAFVLPSTSGMTITITTLTATDAIGVTGYVITEDTATVPSLGAFGTLPTTISAGSDGYHTYRAYARDAAGNISAASTQSCTVTAAVAPTITGFNIPGASTVLSPITISTFTTTNSPTEYAVIVQLATDAAPSTPSVGWVGTAPTSITCPGTADGYFTAYIWCRNSSGTSTVASDSILVIQSNAVSLTLNSMISSTIFDVTFAYDFATSAQGNDWISMGTSTRTITGGVMNVSGTGPALIGMHWQGMTSRTYANNLIQLETATASTSSASNNTLGNLIFGHSDVYDGNPYNPNPGIMLAKPMFTTVYEIDVNGNDSTGGTGFSPALNTFYDISYALNTTDLTISISGHGSYTRTAGAPFAVGTYGHVSFGPYVTSSVWDSITITGRVTV